MKKHYYISKNAALCSFLTEKPRQGHYYIGEHTSEEDAMKLLYFALERLIEKNNKTKTRLGLMYTTDTNEGIIKAYLNEL